MESSVDYLNLEYFLVRFFDLVSGAPVFSAGGVSSGFTAAVMIMFIIGMLLSLIFLILIVYSQIRLLEVEHAGFHMLEARAHEHHEPEVESTGHNGRWEHIVSLASSGSESDWRRAILEADIMLGDELARAGYVGTSVGEQLKVANPIQLTTLDLAWKAHKLRNDVAHGGEGFALSERDKSVAIDYYKRVFEELGAI